MVLEYNSRRIAILRDTKQDRTDKLSMIFMGNLAEIGPAIRKKGYYSDAKMGDLLKFLEAAYQDQGSGLGL